MMPPAMAADAAAHRAADRRARGPARNTSRGEAARPAPRPVRPEEPSTVGQHRHSPNRMFHLCHSFRRALRRLLIIPASSAERQLRGRGGDNAPPHVVDDVPERSRASRDEAGERSLSRRMISKPRKSRPALVHASTMRRRASNANVEIAPTPPTGEMSSV